jgi:UDP-N-acetylmuramoyl-tripeptide--D-alanyl-D-alanine ligase
MKKLFISIFLFYLRSAARIQLWKIKPKIIGLTGSVGKTSLRDAVYAALVDYYRVKKSVKANSETGLPLDILGLHLRNYSVFDWLRVSLLVPIMLLVNWEKYGYYIAEMGVDEPDEPKNMEYLLRFVKPEIAIFLNAKAVHTMQFKNVEAIAKEKGKILERLGEDKIAIANNDDQLVKKEAEKSKAKKYYFGKNGDLKIVGYNVSLNKTEFEYQYKEKRFKISFNFPLARYYSYTFAGAILVGLVVGLSIDKIKKSLEKNFALPEGRGRKFKGVKNSIIIDSSYNASGGSVIGALKLLDRLGRDRDKIFVFGDMRELGNKAKSEHEKVAKKILETVDQLVLIGPLTKKYVSNITKDQILTKWFENSWNAGEWLKENLRGGEIILVKGSQNTIFTEIVVEKLLADKKDANLLCRRGKFWDKMREV